MSEREKEIMNTIAEAVPKMTERQKGRLLGYGEAILDMRKEIAESSREKVAKV